MLLVVTQDGLYRIDGLEYLGEFTTPRDALEGFFDVRPAARAANQNREGSANTFRFQCELLKRPPSYEVAYLQQIITRVLEGA